MKSLITLPESKLAIAVESVSFRFCFSSNMMHDSVNFLRASLNRLVAINIPPKSFQNAPE